MKEIQRDAAACVDDTDTRPYDEIAGQEPCAAKDEYNYHPWKLEEQSIARSLESQSESVFSVGNGFIGVRGVLEEADEHETRARPCVFLNGVFEKVKINYHEQAHGFAQTSDTRIPTVDPTKLSIYTQGEKFSAVHSTTRGYRRWLDYTSGEVVRTLEWKTESGKTLALEFRRLASLSRTNLYVSRVTISSVNFNGALNIESPLDARFDDTQMGDVKASSELAGEKDHSVHDPRRTPKFASSPWRCIETITSSKKDLDSQRCSAPVSLEAISGFTHELKDSGYRVASLVAYKVTGAKRFKRQQFTSGGLITDTLSCQLKEGEAVSLEKLVSYTASQNNEENIIDAGRRTLNDAYILGYNGLLTEQKSLLGDIWNNAEFSIDGSPKTESALKFNTVQLIQAAGRDGLTSLSAKGQTGEGYEGHYFWDAEILCLPFFVFNKPSIAKKMLEFRYHGLNAARNIAKLMGHKVGALYPWRTISGDECSAFFPAGTAQYHINADIAYAIKLYHDATGDNDFIFQYGAEIIWETARIWLQVGFFNARQNGHFVINSVTGPDEYTAIVNNNLYTNVMAQAHLEYAIELYDRIVTSERSERIRQLVAKLGLKDAEVNLWRNAAHKMLLPYDDTLGIHKQDDSFLEKEVWDIDATPKDHYPLLLHYHPLTLYRYQVSKQADTVLALLLQSNRFTHDDKRRNYHYYKKVCVHDSTLSPCAYSIIASEIGELDEAADFFAKSVFIDLENLHGNSGHGLHMAAMGGAWMCLVYGFGGMRLTEGKLNFSPQAPTSWKGYSFRINFLESLLKLTVGGATVSLELLNTKPCRCYLYGQEVELDQSTPAWDGLLKQHRD
ncbi:MAG: alpha,alpha-trehalose phosphorylase [Flavobacteriales bacterium]|jgi:alpha,alpha-trehalose phosphorylase